MLSSSVDTLKDYCEQLIEQIRDEVNVKEVIFQVGNQAGTDWRLATLWFTGDILHDMDMVRESVKEGLKQRADAKIKVRQPLQSITMFKAAPPEPSKKEVVNAS